MPSQTDTKNLSQPPTGRFLETEVEFQGRYKTQVWESLREAYAPWLTPMILTLLIGLIARTCLVGSASLVGLWIDSQCSGVSCRELCSKFKYPLSRHCA